MPAVAAVRRMLPDLRRSAPAQGRPAISQHNGK